MKYSSSGMNLRHMAEVFVATEDGSVGTKGNVIDAIREQNA